ncbi:PIG-L family deacetylase [Acaricomes phytoseiuli]|uniref:PIG-L family deacetylase n=1 Tax=Acaricomes phytoseiuli TaxID=291968 RepID=UPI000368AB02|nr:PIG-L family deacetylase [Acaricomes phytoseiuli]MCW1249778.1 PIG-L family deacetylase [Acaricomes phytoseiuli]
MSSQQNLKALPQGFLPPRPSAPDGQYRVLFVHAHPDDESITTGATMALLGSLGVDVTLLTVTRGELGEVIPEDLRHLEQGLPKPGRSGDSVPDGGSGLAQVRTRELVAAASRLGVQRRMFLGEVPALAPGSAPRVYRDSGMSWGPDGRAQPAAEVLPGAFTLAPLEETAEHTASLIRTLRPDTVVSYAADGGYGHPDHRRAHEMTVRAVELAARSADAARGAWDVPLLHAIASATPADETLTDHAGSSSSRGRLSIIGWSDAKREAIQAHRTQAVVDQDRFALSDLVMRPFPQHEEFQTLRRGRSHSGPGRFRSVLGAVVAGIAVSMLGTLLHEQRWGFIPWGILAALLLVGTAIVFIAAWARSVPIGGVTGMAAYLGCVLWALPRGRFGLIQANTAGSFWLYGVALVTVIFLLRHALRNYLKARRA